MKTGLPPIIDSNATLLILGSLPGDQSIAQQQYYANPRNHFWAIVAQLLGEPLPDSYPARTALLQRHGVALWDVLHSAERAGSLDSSIRDPQANDLRGLVARHPGLRLVALNGGKAAVCYRRHFADLPLPCALLRSSSPVPAQRCNTLPEKTEQWQTALQAAGWLRPKSNCDNRL